MRLQLDNWCASWVKKVYNIWPVNPGIESTWREEDGNINCFRRRFGQDGSDPESGVIRIPLDRLPL